MKKLLLILVLLFTFGINVNAQDYASTDDNGITLVSDNYNENITPEVAELKAKLLKRTKEAFKEAKVKVPSDLEIVLINKSSSITRWIVTYQKNNKKKLVLGILHGERLQTIKPINYIEKSDEDPYFLIYKNY